LGDDANFASTITTSIAGRQAALNGTGFVKISGTTISYDNSTYLTTSSASSSYLPLAGGTLTGALNGTSAVFTGSVFSNGNLASATGNQGANTTSATLFLGNRGYFSDQTIGAATIRAISTGTFWYSGTALSFSTNPGPDVTSASVIERMRITSDGEVNVFNNLNLNYSYPRINLNDTDHNSDYSIINADGNFTIYDSTAGANRLLITSGGNVIVGNATGFPSKKLEISDNNNSTSEITGLKIINYSLTANARSGIVFQSYDNNGAAIWSNRTGTTTGELLFGTNNSAGTAETNIAERMRIYSDGVVTTRIIQLNDPTYFASNFYGIRLVGVDNGSNGTNFQIQGRTTPTGGFSTLFTLTNSGTAVFSNSVTASGGFEVSNSQFYKARRASGNLLLDLLGIESGTDNTRLLITGDFNIKSGSLSTLFNMTTTGITTFSSSVTATRLTANADNSGLIVDVAARHGFMKYFNYATGLVGKNTGTDSGISTWLGRWSGSDITAPTGVFQDLVINNSGNIGIGTAGPTTRLDIGNGTLTVPTLRGRTYQLSNVSSQNPTFVNGTGFNSIPVRVGDIIDLPFSQTRTVTAVTDTQLTVDSAWTVSFAGSNVEGRGGIIFQTNNTERMHITSGGNILIPGNVQFGSVLSTVFNISLSGMSAGSWFNLTTFNFNGFSGLVSVTIPNLDSNYGYISQSSAWIFQQGANQEPVYDGIRGVTVRPDGVSYEGYHVVESYHTAPVSGRVNMRMRLRPRNAGLGAANPINLQIWVDHTVGITAGTPTLSIKRV
jgi:hypothetical protein